MASTFFFLWGKLLCEKIEHLLGFGLPAVQKLLLNALASKNGKKVRTFTDFPYLFLE